MHRDRAGIVERGELAQFEPRLADFSDPGRLNGQFFRADHGARHIVRRQVRNTAVTGELAAAQDGDLVGERHHLAEFMRDHQDRQIALDDHGAQHAEHLVCFARRQHRCRLVQDQKFALEVELLEDFAFLPLARGDVRHPGVERHPERHAREERFEVLFFPGPIDNGRDIVARQHQVFGYRHRRHQREMLVHHAEAKRVGVLRIGDRLLAAADQHLALGRVVVTHDAFDQRALAGAVFAEQRMEGSGTYFQFDIVQCCEFAEPHGHGNGVDAERPARHRHFADNHDNAPIRLADVATAPNTPPCILIIFNACS